jgi:transcriptional regulator with XRE-family HTH domain
MQTIKKYNRIKVELTEAGKLSAELAAFLGVHASTVSDWCTNTNQPSIKDLYRIAEFLQTDVRNLLVPNLPKPGIYSTGFTSELNIAAEPEAVYTTKGKPVKTTGKPKTKRKKPH